MNGTVNPPKKEVKVVAPGSYSGIRPRLRCFDCASVVDSRGNVGRRFLDRGNSLSRAPLGIHKQTRGNARTEGTNERELCGKTGFACNEIESSFSPATTKNNNNGPVYSSDAKKGIGMSLPYGSI